MDLVHLVLQNGYHLHSGKLEFLALKWSICEQLRDCLYHAPSFRVYAGYNSLTYVLTSAKLNVTGLRWIGELADFNFDIRYRPGKTHVDADAYSRIPFDFETYIKSCTEDPSPVTYKHTQRETNQLRQQPISYITILSSVYFPHFK